ncbi:MAG: hypothetical protein U0R51_10725 [Solirubrobacterales bacterium]
MGRGWLAFGIALAVLGGCGDGSAEDVEPGRGGAIELTGWLPPASGYASADLVALKRDLGLAEDADPLASSKLFEWIPGGWAGLYLSNPSKETRAALQLSAATEFAEMSIQKDEQPVTAIRTSADTDEIRQKLIDLGFVDRNGILEGPDGMRATGWEDTKPELCGSAGGLEPCGDRDSYPEKGLAVKIEDDVILLSPDAAKLAVAPDDPGGPPLEVQSLLDADVTYASGYDYQCVRQNGIATSPDGTGEMAAIFEGSSEALKITPEPGSEGVGQPVFDGDAVTVELDLPKPMGPRQFQSDEFAGISCANDG